MRQHETTIQSGEHIPLRKPALGPGDSLPCYCVGQWLTTWTQIPRKHSNPATGSGNGYIMLHRVTSTMMYHDHQYPQISTMHKQIKQPTNRKHRPSRWKHWTLVSHGVTPSHLWVTLASHPSHSWKVACLGLGNFC